MKILQILPALGQGGVERGTLEIAAALSRAGIENAVVSSGGAMVPQLEKTGARHFTMQVQSKNPIRIIANAFAIASLAKKGGYTLMHVRSRAPAWSVYFASKISRIPYIATYHGLYGTSPRLFKIPYNRVMLKGVKTIAVSDCVREHILRGGHELQHLLHACHSHNGKHDAQDKRHGHGGLHRGVQAVHIPCPEILADQDSRAY